MATKKSKKNVGPELAKTVNSKNSYRFSKEDLEEKKSTKKKTSKK